MTRGAHTADCALIMYADVDPSTLKQPLMCDCDGEPEADQPPPQQIGPTATLTGPAARALLLYRKAEREFRAAQTKRDAALAAFTEAVIE